MNKLIILLVMTFCMSACDKVLLGEDDNLVSLEENLGIPPALNDGWEVSSLESENINAVMIRNLVRQFYEDPRGVNSILIIRNNKLVLESYFGGWYRERLQSLRSASKSVASALVGIAIDKGYISSVHQKLFDFFPEYSDLKTDQKNKIELQHVLSMSSGQQWDQTTHPFDEAGNDEGEMYRSMDGLRYVLQKEVVSEPGVWFNYSSGNSDLLTGIIHHTTGVHADVFAEENLFRPLGIKKYGWRKNNDGYSNAGWGLHLYPRDMAKIGQLFLDNGKWKGQQVISGSWVKESTGEYTKPFPTVGYGYQWWVWTWTINGQTIKTFHAQGNGGQVICVVPDLNSVIVLTGTNYDSDDGQIPYNMLRGYILPSLKK